MFNIYRVVIISLQEIVCRVIMCMTRKTVITFHWW